MTEAGAPDSADSFVVGTAGHIDHGKSTLVKALTQIDPDRLEEEKRRGMTIDLGFAYLDLPSGRHVGIVDVPGHQRFLKNMLAGVHGMDAVLLVVAADEGPMPQTREHLAIIDLLGIEHGVVVLSKADLVDAEWIRLVSEEVKSMLSRSGLRSAPIVPVSSTAGIGLDELRIALDRELERTRTRPDLGRPRLPIDRAFGMAGFGTVVTGTLIGGILRQGDEVAILPGERRARIRGLQQHNRPVAEARPGSRTAVNLAGVDRAQVRRGDVLAMPRTMSASRRLDARLTVLVDAAQVVRHRARLLLYHDTAEIPIEVSLLDADELGPGEHGWAQLYAASPTVALAGDRFIIRVPSPPTTVAGGVIVDAAPRRHRRRDPEVLEELRRREGGDAATRAVLELVKHPRGIDEAALARTLAVSAPQFTAALDPLLAARAVHRLGSVVLAAEHYRRLEATATDVLATFHHAEPLRRGMPKEALRSRIGLPANPFAALVAALAADGVVVEGGTEVALASHHARPSADEAASIDALTALLDSQPFAPPLLAELIQRFALTPALVQYLIAEGVLVRISDEVVFGRAAVDEAVLRLRAYLAANRTLTVAVARDLLSSSRRYVLPLLEWLDAQKITRRVGDDRILRD
ncbi:MAG: selenocysteine-specific translation elongation factor [Candidatus Dormibacteraeota bacterium]|nr:selenocysteine-specific translation elongation factor [Candidatus Dormibacteraeota bacterium]